MPTAINSRACKKYEAGTGLVDCELFFGEPSMFFLARKGWSVNVITTQITKETIIESIRLGDLIPFQASKAFTENTPDPTRQDYASGKRRTIRNGNPDYMFEFDNGIGFHKAAYSFNGGNFELINVDASGNWQLQSSIDETLIKGFSLSDLNTRTYRQQSGDTAAGTMVEMQVSDPEVFNRQMALISVEDIGFNANDEIKGVVSVKIKLLTATVDDGEVTAVVEVNSLNNRKTGIQALTLLNFEALNITENTISSIITVTPDMAQPGKYTLLLSNTLPWEALDNIKIQTKGYSLGQATRISGTMQLYKGESNAVVVTNA